MADRLRANLYVDGYNLYYRALRRSKSKWLDLSKLAARILPNHDIGRIRYFTARAKPRPWKPTSPQRQQVYLRALETIPNLEIEYGRYVLKKPAWAQLRYPHQFHQPVRGTQAGELDHDNPCYVQVAVSEEKGSDCNLATMIMVDAFKKDCDLIALITNDSDLVLPVKKAREQGIEVRVYAPCDKPSNHLKAVATHLHSLAPEDFAACQFPDTLIDSSGRSITKPPSW